LADLRSIVNKYGLSLQIININISFLKESYSCQVLLLTRELDPALLLRRRLLLPRMLLPRLREEKAQE
jgi:hypothetical protein